MSGIASASRIALFATFVSSIFLIAPQVDAAVGRTAGSFNVSQTGEAQYSIPIFTPPGTGEMTLRLALTYGHRGGNGLLGVGWNISALSAITRCPKTWAQDGAPRNVRLDYNDRFCLDGNQLKLESGTYGNPNAVYRTELETFARVTSYGTAGFGPAYFVVEHKNGLIYEYGNTTDSRIESQFVASARTWALNKIRDRSQNAILFSYTEDATNGSYRINSIQYTSNPAQGLTAAYAVSFFYESVPVGEVDSRFRAGGLVKRITRLDRIDVTHSGSLVRRYDLSYLPLSSTSKSRLGSVQECAGTTPDCLPASIFTYQGGTSAFLGEFPTTTIGGTSNVLVIDINGDGRSDVVYSSTATSGTGTWMYMLANSSGGYNAPVNSTITNFNFSQAIPLDYNADGLEDFLVPYSGGTWWVVHGSASSGLSSPVNTAIAADGAGGNARAFDVNGDGLDDLVWAYHDGQGGDSILYRLRVWGGTFAATPTYWFGPVGLDFYIHSNVFGNPLFISRRRQPDFNGDGCADFVVRSFFSNPEIGPPVHYATALLGCGAGTLDFSGGYASGGTPPNIQFADLNADGYTDVAWGVTSGTWYYRISKGTSLGPLLSLSVGTGFLPETAVAVDADTDGYEDVLVRKSTTNTWHLIRSTGEALLSPSNTTLATTTTKSFVGDVDGDGLVDVLSLNGSTLAYRKHGGPEPDLLTSATDGFGAAVNFSYVPITQGNYSKYSDAVYPEQDYQGALYVVSTLTASTGIASPSTFTQSFWYYGARMQRQGRGFEGFYAKRTTDNRNNLYAYDYFNRAFPHSGTVFQSDLYQPNGTTLISRTQNNWTAHSYSSGYELRKFPFVNSSTSTHREVGGTYDGTEVRTVATAATVDTYGTVTDTTTTTTEVATGLHPGATHTQRVWHLAVTNDATNWCLGKPTQTQLINSHTLNGGMQITRTINHAWEALKCRMTQRVIEPSSTQWKVTTDFGYDDDPGNPALDFGNLTTETVTPVGQAARVTSVNWGTTGQFPLTITNPLSQNTTLTWVAEHGLLDTATDPNSLVTNYDYDVFGRMTRELRADGTATRRTYLACDANNSYCGWGDSLLRFRIQTDQRNISDAVIHDAYVSYDQLGREKYPETRTLAGAVSASRTDYDALGRVTQRLLPRILGSSDPSKYLTYTYDLLNRMKKEEREVSEANSSLQSTQWDYNGLSVTETNALSQATTKKFNAIGQVIQVFDAGGSDTDYEYDAFGNLLKTRDVMSNEIALGYNIRGFKTSSSDPDLGSWSYDYFPLGELKSQTNAKSQTVNFTYDKLSRPLTRVEPEGTTTWTWGTSAASHNIGHLASVSSPGSYSETYTYDSFARRSQTAIVADGATYNINQSYDTATGFQDTLTYPTSTSGVRIKLKYSYQNGYLHKVNDFTGDVLGTKYWEALATNARGLVIDEELGNGLRSFSKYDHIAGFLDYRQTGPGGGSATLNLDYAWDKLGNLTQRQDLNLSLTEGFVYDNLNRLDYTTGVSSLNVDYDAIGRITLKSDVGSYTYHATKKHAVIAAGSNSYAYDANGNLSTRNGKSITWTSYDLPSLIQPTTDTNYNQFFYDAWRGRYKQVYKAGTPLETTIYVGGMLEKWVRGSSTQWRHLIQVNGRTVALLNRSGTTNTVRYPLEDHLSGMAVLTTSAGGVYVKESFDAFGKRRNPNSWVGAPSSGDLTLIRDASRRGFTLHEHLDNTALIHMNGRVQDPTIGRVISADPFVPEPFDGQSFNRYSYVDNNPLSFIDPSGFEEESLHHDFGNAPSWQVLAEWGEWLNWQQRDPVERGSDPNAPQSEACDENNHCQSSVPQSTGGGSWSAWNLVGISAASAADTQGLFDRL